jgi:hypothetical protein
MYVNVNVTKLICSQEARTIQSLTFSLSWLFGMPRGLGLANYLANAVTKNQKICYLPITITLKTNII